jgi:hypothetical protein
LVIEGGGATQFRIDSGNRSLSAHSADVGAFAGGPNGEGFFETAKLLEISKKAPGERNPKAIC